MPEKEKSIRYIGIYIGYLLVVWGFYRFLFKLPEDVEELTIKPLIWLLPVLFLLKKEKKGIRSLGVTTNNLVPAIYLALTLGVIFAIEGIVVNFIKYEGIDFSANLGGNLFFTSLVVSFATAVSEEVSFRGYIFNRIWQYIGDEWKANLITSLIWALIHVPAAIFWWELSAVGVLGYLLLTTIFGIGSAFVFARTKNVFSSILLHVMWEWPIVLFR